MDRQRMRDLIAHPERATPIEVRLLAQYSITCQDVISTFLKGAAAIGDLIDNAKKLNAVMDKSACLELMVKTSDNKN